ncbi:MAG: hypothetical protein H6706_21315 [Myxococcales bacterium]|nr:hypothetical protein [Myxococcales bacterium]
MSADVFVRRVFPLTRAAGAGRQLAIELGSAGAAFDARALVAQARRVGAEGLVVLLPAAEEAVAALQAEAGDLPVARGNAPAGGAQPVELFPGAGESLLLGADSPGNLSEIRGLSYGEDRRPGPADAERLAFLEALLRGERFQPTATGQAALAESARPSLSVLEAGGHRIARLALAALLRAGGHQPRTVLRDGQRVRGCLWDAALVGDFQLAWSAGTTRLWAHGVVELPALQRSGERERRRIVRRWLQVADTEVGDWLFLLQVAPGLVNQGLGGAEEEVLGRLYRASPLLALSDLAPSTAGELGRLLEPRAVRVVECWQGPLASAWRRRLQGILGEAAPARAVASVATVLGLWLRALDAGQRLDLATALLQITAELLALVPPGRLRDRFQARQVPRDEGRDAGVRLYGLGEALAQHRDAMAQVRYGDERHAEAQLYLAEYAAHLTPEILAALSAARRTAGGVIG